MLSIEAQGKLKRSLIKHEGRKTYPYVDTKGYITWGIGYNASLRGVKDKIIDDQYEEDVSYFQNELSKFDWFIDCSEDRKIVLIDMCFNLGLKKLLSFTSMISYLKKKDYQSTALEMLQSEWAKEVKSRALDLAQGMSKGIYQI